MQLSENLFAEITGVTLSPHSERECDRRSCRRVAFDHRARIFPLMEGVGEAGAVVLVRDISVSGIGFLFSEPIGVGDEFVIRLPTTTEQPIDIQCAARRCEMSGTCGSQYAVGATFELVLNRPISACIAPESEMQLEQEPLVDQPAPPTIEQRYDRQIVASRLIRPVICEPRWDRWMAKPSVQTCTRVLKRILWPALVVWNGIESVLQAGEEAHIRSRLTPNKAARKSKRKSRAAVVLPRSISTAVPDAQQSAANAQPPLAAIFHPHLFEVAQSPTGMNNAATAPVAPPTGRRSLFSATEILPAEGAPLTSAIEKAAEPAAPQAATAPSVPQQSAGCTATPTECKQSPVTEIATVPIAEPLPTPATTASEAQPTEVVRSLPCEKPSISENTDAPPADVQPADDGVQTVFAESSRSENPSAKPRRPVAHPRQPRRRQRPTYHR